MKKILLIAFGLFLSQSNAQTLLEEGFEGATFPPTGWTTFIGTNGLGTNQNWKLETLSVHTGSQASFVRFENVANGSFAEDWMVTSQVDLSSVSQVQLSFFTRKQFAYQNAMNNTYYIKVSETSQTDHNSFTVVKSWTDQQLVADYTTYEQKMVDLSAYVGKKVYVAFVMTNDNGNGWFIDDVKISGQSTENPATLPYQYGFEADDSWTKQNLGLGNIWTIEENNSFYSASEGTKYGRYRYNAENSANAWYISRGIQLTKDTPIEIKFDYKTGEFNGIEKLKVAIGKSKEAANLTNIIWDNNGGTELTNTAWETGTIQFTPTEDGVYYLGFNTYSDPNQMYVFIDNVRIDEAILGVNQTKKENLTIYPNPVKDVLNLKNDSEISKISVYSLDGKLIRDKKVHSKETTINLSGISSGSYIGVIESANGNKQTVKLIKK